MFKKILIANRGEIACRVIRTARRLGIKTVAVYSDADADALHVREADEAVRIGPPPSAQSYLLIDAIIAACKQTGAEAVHPGYGFLSERATFPEALEKEGIVFIGPKPHAIRAMGDKIESKKLAEQAGVSTVPGYLAAIADAEAAVKIARDVGFPVMLKASAGGGGKGMRIARIPMTEVARGLHAATNEAKSSFGDDRVFLERYHRGAASYRDPGAGRHAHGNVVYLGERECSVQRRQPEGASRRRPRPFLDESDPPRHGRAGGAARQGGALPDSAGTVEFVVDKDRNFFFLEMNTRLQVEHPVTEIDHRPRSRRADDPRRRRREAPLAQNHVTLTGWAMESRHLCRGPVPRLPAGHRAALTRYRPPPRALRRRRGSRRHRRL
jgi:propionyl-CoA carboxylase alpha chain